MGHSVKIALVGAGSSTFSADLVRDMVLSEVLAGSTLSLMDIDRERLEGVTELVGRYVKEVHGDLNIESTERLEEALEGADFVINTALAGGHTAEEAERSLAEALGYYRGVRPLHMQRNLLLMLRVAQAVERIAPNAWLLQVSNPVFEGCTFITRETRAKVVGICHGYRGYEKVATLIGVDPKLVSWQAPGFNHVIYLTDFSLDGVSLYPRLDQWIEASAEKHWASTDLSYGASDLSRAAVDLYRRVGLLPLGDTTRGFDTWWYNSDLSTKKFWFGHLGGFDSEIGWQVYLDHLEDRLAEIRRAVADREKPVTETIPLVNSRENHVPVIEALVTGQELTTQVNLPNNGAIDGLPDDIVVEGKGIVSRDQVQLLHVGRLPRSLMSKVLWPRWTEAERVLGAVQTHDFGTLREIVLADHRTQSTEQADKLLSGAFGEGYNAEVVRWYGGSDS